MTNLKPPVAFTLPELRALLTKTREHDQRCYVLFLIAVSHGLRVSEVIALKKRNFTTSSSEMFIKVARLKGSLRTTQKLLTNDDPLLDEKAVVAQYLEGIKPNGYLFTNEHGQPLTRFGVNFLLKRYGTWAGLPEHKIHPHALKHTLGVTMREAGARLEEIQVALGHVTITSTAQYLRVTSEAADTARAKAFTQTNSTAMAAAVGGD